MKYLKLAKVFILSIDFLGLLFLFLAIYLKMPAKNDESIVGLKGIMLIILFVVNTSSHSLYNLETYYINNKCRILDNQDFEDNYDLVKKVNKSLSKLFVFNFLVLSSSIFLIISILSNIIESVVLIYRESLIRISFYSFLIFLVMIIFDYLLYNLLLYTSFRKILG
ncbi:hypothetical protein [Desulfurella sp.]|uniref:hypothetical protein n=1 Tax=Desulfurella sp. TaxID=1962857 RepID=UPI003D1466C3